MLTWYLIADKLEMHRIGYSHKHNKFEPQTIGKVLQERICLSDFSNAKYIASPSCTLIVSRYEKTRCRSSTEIAFMDLEISSR